MAHALRDHQAVDAVSSEVFHVAIEQAGALAVEDAIAIANHSANGSASPVERLAANAGGHGPQIRVAILAGLAALKLVGIRELVHRDLVLVGVAGPGPI